MSTTLIYKKTNPMSTVELRSRIDDFLNQVDENFLKVVHAMLETQIENQASQVVGYEPNGDPITLAQLKERVKQSEEDYKNGNYVTLEQLEKEMEQW